MGGPVKLSGHRVLITGAAGFIGSHLADRLAGTCALRLVDDFSVGSRDNLRQLEGAQDVEIIAADVTDTDRMADLVAGTDVVFHLAISCLRTSLHDPFLSHDTNAGGTLAVGLAARDAGVERFVYVSSSEIYGTALSVPMREEHPCEPTTVYGASKLAGEHYALALWRTYGLPVSVVRPFNTYGPREPWATSRAEVIPRFTLQLLNGRSPVVYGDGTQTRDFTFVDDTVTGLVAAAECDALVGQVVNVARGGEASILDVAQRLCRVTGVDLPVVRAEARPGDVRRHFADVAKARRLLGFRARIDLDEGLERTVAWIRESGIAARPEARQAGQPNW
jgi:UDP-glucose 4-epimerase